MLALVVIGWALARDIGHAAAPTFFRRMDPATAGAVGFMIRLGTLVITGLAALRVAGLNPQALAVGGRSALSCWASLRSRRSGT